MIDNGDGGMTLWALVLAMLGVMASVALGEFLMAPAASLGPLAGLLP